jgi:hypothetical protein
MSPDLKEIVAQILEKHDKPETAHEIIAGRKAYLNCTTNMLMEIATTVRDQSLDSAASFCEIGIHWAKIRRAILALKEPQP